MLAELIVGRLRSRPNVSSWRYLISLFRWHRLPCLIQTVRDLCSRKPLVRRSLVDNYGQIGSSDFGCSPTALGGCAWGSCLSCLPSWEIRSVALTWKETERKHEFGLELNALSSGDPMGSVADVVRDSKAGTITLHFDELRSGANAARRSSGPRMLIGLGISPLREIKEGIRKRIIVPLVPIVYLSERTCGKSLQFSDKNKITQNSFAYNLRWDNDSLLEVSSMRAVRSQA